MLQPALQLHLQDLHVAAVRPPESFSSSALHSPSLVYNITQPHLLKHNQCACAGDLPCPSAAEAEAEATSYSKVQSRKAPPAQVMHSNQDQGALAAQVGMQGTPASHRAAIYLVTQQRPWGLRLSLCISSRSSKTHLHSPQVVRPNRDQGALAAKIGVQLVLEVDEAVVARSIKLDFPQDSTHEKGAHQRCLGAHHHALHLAACSRMGCRFGTASVWSHTE